MITGDWAMLGENGSSFYWFSRIAGSLTSLWMGLEATWEYARSRRRRKIGLCDPITSNRFALWAIAASIWFFMEIGIIVQAQGIGQGVSEVLAIAIPFEAAFEALGAFLLGLGFFPPEFYRRWVQGSHPAEPSVSV